VHERKEDCVGKYKAWCVKFVYDMCCGAHQFSKLFFGPRVLWRPHFSTLGFCVSCAVSYLPKSEGFEINIISFLLDTQMYIQRETKRGFYLKNLLFLNSVTLNRLFAYFYKELVMREEVFSPPSSCHLPRLLVPTRKVDYPGP